MNWRTGKPTETVTALCEGEWSREEYFTASYITEWGDNARWTVGKYQEEPHIVKRWIPINEVLQLIHQTTS